MNDPISPPAERDLPPGRAIPMRAELLTAARGPRPRVSRRLLATVAAVLTLVAGAAVTLEVRREPAAQVLAMSPGELDQGLRHAVRQCVTWLEPEGHDGTGRTMEPLPVPVSMATVTMAARQGPRTAILFLADTGYLACDVSMPAGEEVTGSTGGEKWPHQGWLPGPVQRLSLISTEADGGAVAVLGRVSARVHRLVLEHDTGRTTTARLGSGTFGLITRTFDVQRDAELVSYDAAGREIDRRRLFQPSDEFTHCYTDPAGTVIYGEPGPDCRPADPWTR